MRLGACTLKVNQSVHDMSSNDRDDAIREGDPPIIPRSNRISRRDTHDERRKTWSLKWLWPVPIGMFLASLLLAQFARSPGDPSGHIMRRLGRCNRACRGVDLAAILLPSVESPHNKSLQTDRGRITVFRSSNCGGLQRWISIPTKSTKRFLLYFT